MLEWFDFLMPIIRSIIERCGEERARATLDDPNRRLMLSARRANFRAGLRGVELTTQTQDDLRELADMGSDEKDDLIAMSKEAA